MKTLIPILIVLSVLLLLNACSIENERLPDPGEFNFTYNGKDYHIKPYNSNVEVISKGNLTIRMPDVFGGEIYFDINSCAYLAPELTTIYKDLHCNLTSQVDGIILPIDSSKVFIYQSGSLNLTISDCSTNTFENPHPEGGSSYTVSSCRASGTFDLTLVNKNNETIEITNGIIKDFPSGN